MKKAYRGGMGGITPRLNYDGSVMAEGSEKTIEGAGR